MRWRRMGRLAAAVAGLTTAIAWAGACSDADTPSAVTIPAEAATPAEATTPAEAATSSERVMFSTGDGLVLEGTVFVPSDAGRAAPASVVLLHMFPSDQTSWRAFAETLAGKGFLALTVNFRGYGASGGTKDIALIDRDVEAAVDFLRGRGEERIVLVGASMGGTAAMVVGARREAIVGVAALSAPPEFGGLDAKDAVGKLTAPTLFIAARDDGSAADSAQRFAEAAVAAGSDASTQLLPGREHGTQLLGADDGDEVTRRLLEFIEAAALGANRSSSS